MNLGAGLSLCLRVFVVLISERVLQRELHDSRIV